MNKKIGFNDLNGWLKILAVFVSVEVIFTIAAMLLIVIGFLMSI